jgi:hypothetical protein
LGRRPPRPIFEPGRVTNQAFLWGFACYQAAMLGVMEATIESDDEKNSFCPPFPFWDKNEDYLSAFLATMAADRARAAHPQLAQWVKTTRLNPASGFPAYRDDPGMTETRERIKRFAFPAALNLQKLLAR